MNIEQIALAVCVGLSLCCMIVSMIALQAMVRVWVKLEAFEKSTHQIQYVPVEPTLNENGEEISGEKLEENIRKALGQEQIEREYL